MLNVVCMVQRMPIFIIHLDVWPRHRVRDENDEVRLELTVAQGFQ
jgi:hypothetical protein